MFCELEIELQEVNWLHSESVPLEPVEDFELCFSDLVVCDLLKTISLCDGKRVLRELDDVGYDH